MSNICDFVMKVVGEKPNIKKLVEYLKNDYWYVDKDTPLIPDEEQIKKYSFCFEEGDRKLYTNADKHFFRIFEAYTNNTEDGEISFERSKDGRWETIVYGDCAWSVACCMLDYPLSYYRDDKNSELKDHRTTLEIESKELDLDIEVVSSEPGMCFAEHYLISKGQVEIDEEFNYQEYYLGDFDTKQEAEKEYGITITDSEWEEQDYISRCEIETFSPNWTI